MKNEGRAGSVKRKTRLRKGSMREKKHFKKTEESEAVSTVHSFDVVMKMNRCSCVCVGYSTLILEILWQERKKSENGECLH